MPLSLQTWTLSLSAINYRCHRQWESAEIEEEEMDWASVISTAGRIGALLDVFKHEPRSRGESSAGEGVTRPRCRGLTSSATVYGTQQRPVTGGWSLRQPQRLDAESKGGAEFAVGDCREQSKEEAKNLRKMQRDENKIKLCPVVCKQTIEARGWGSERAGEGAKKN